MKRWLIAAVVVAGCGEAAGTERSGFVAADTVADLPNCNPSTNRTLYYVGSTDEFYYCDGSEYILMNLSGRDGEAGMSWAIETEEASTCPAGGTTISIGPDADGDGIIDEVRSSETICNGASCVATESGGMITLECPSGSFEIPIPSDGAPGAPGTDGVDGAPGQPCVVFTEAGGLRIVCPGSEGFVPYAEPGQVGPQGPAGTDGVSWAIETEEASSCPAGGTTIHIGPDADGDGIIDEVRSSETTCNGVDSSASVVRTIQVFDATNTGRVHTEELSLTEEERTSLGISSGYTYYNEDGFLVSSLYGDIETVEVCNRRSYNDVPLDELLCVTSPNTVAVCDPLDWFQHPEETCVETNYDLVFGTWSSAPTEATLYVGTYLGTVIEYLDGSRLIHEVFGTHVVVTYVKQLD
jgi:hypothetical protein